MKSFTGHVIDCEGVHPIAESPLNVADIVFVHGLGGNSHSTWRYGQQGGDNHFFWPEQIAQAYPKCNVWTLGYAAGFTELGNPGMVIEIRARNLAHQMALAGIGGRPVIFITHSMGGLIIKSLIVSSQLLDDPDATQIASNVRGIVFCGTPHRGSAFASAATILGKMFGGAQAHVHEMSANAQQLDMLNDKFVAWHRSNPLAIESFVESLGLYKKGFFGRLIPLGMVVPRASANLGIGPIYDVDADHLSLVKPAPSVPAMGATGVRLARMGCCS